MKPEHKLRWGVLAPDRQHGEVTRLAEDYGGSRQVDAQFALIDLATGTVRNPLHATATLRDQGQQLSSWAGRIYQKLSSNLRQWVETLFTYVPLLDAALQPLRDQ
jgi:hypothetical protein